MFEQYEKKLKENREYLEQLLDWINETIENWYTYSGDNIEDLKFIKESIEERLKG